MFGISRQGYYQRYQRIEELSQVKAAVIKERIHLPPLGTRKLYYLLNKHQNALAERINGILKEEFLIVKPKHIGQARIIIAQAVKLYNERRPHLALNYLTPQTVHQQKVLANVT